MNRIFRAAAAALTLMLASACAMSGPKGASNGNASVVLVAGATGGTGQEVVDQALEKGYRVRALVRDEAKARMLFGDRVQYVVGMCGNLAP